MRQLNKDFLASMEEKIAPNRHGFKTWFDCLDKSAQKELSVVREKYKAGGYSGRQKRAIANAVIAAAKERGWRVSGVQGVIAWLDRP